MTSEYGVVLIKSLALLNHIIDNPVSIEDALKTKEYDNGKVADEIKKALDKKRKEQINEARTSMSLVNNSLKSKKIKKLKQPKTIL